jgi:hypothetical protein
MIYTMPDIKNPRKNRGLINIYGGGIRRAISDGLREGGQRFTGAEHKPLHDRWFSVIARLPTVIQLMRK